MFDFDYQSVKNENFHVFAVRRDLVPIQSVIFH